MLFATTTIEIDIKNIKYVNREESEIIDEAREAQAIKFSNNFFIKYLKLVA